MNDWLLEWATTIADQRVHGTTHELPQERFARAEREQLTALGPRPLYSRERVTHRIVAPDALVANRRQPLLGAGELRRDDGHDPRVARGI